MRVLAHACALVLLVLSAVTSSPAASQAAATTLDSSHRFIVVTFSNEPFRPSAHAGTTGTRYTGDNYGVAQTAHDKARRVASSYSLRRVASWPIKQLAVHCVVYQIPDARSVADVLKEMTRDPRITLAQPLQQFHTLTAGVSYNDPLFGLQTNLAKLGISAAHERSQGAGIRIALIDTGVDADHPDLRERIVSSRSFITTNAGTAGAYRHGTAMAGLIAAVANNRVGIVGIAPQAKIEVFEACWQLKPDTDAAACNTFTLAKALAAAIEAGAPLINLSIAGPRDPLLAALVQNALKSGVIVVGSTADETDAFPTNIDGVISVGNSEREQRRSMLYAPATHVLTLRPGGQYDFESGTSVAAAQITGIVALLLSSNSRLRTDSVVALLKTTSDRAETPSGEPLSIDVNAALGRLLAEQSSGRLAATRSSR